MTKRSMAGNDLALLLPQSGSLSKTGWELPETLTEADWKQAGSALSRVEGALMWWIGDWWAFGNHNQHRTSWLIIGLVSMPTKPQQDLFDQAA